MDWTSSLKGSFEMPSLNWSTTPDKLQLLTQAQRTDRRVTQNP